MFYSQYILAKKGPLGTIWIAAHLEKKLRKNQVNDTNISTSVDSILFPEVPIALRLSGHLLLGVVRIYSRKVNYLFHDCNDALVKLKNAFSSATSASVDLPADAASAPFHSITLPETFEFDDIDVLYIPDGVDHHVTTRDQITLEENVVDDTYPGSQFEQDERFMETPHAMDIGNEKFPLNEAETPELQEDVLPPMDMDVGPSSPLDADTVPDIEKLRSASLAGEENFHAFEKQSVEPVAAEPREDAVVEEARLVEDEQPLPSTPVSRSDANSPGAQRFPDGDETPAFGVVETPVPSRKNNTPRKRKQAYDMQVTLSESYMKDMLNDSSDLRRVRRKVSPKEIWIFQKERLGKRTLSTPSVDGLCSRLEQLYDRVFNPKRLKASAPNVTFAADGADVETTPVQDRTKVQSPPKSPLATPQSPGGVSPAPVRSPEQSPLEVRNPSPQQLYAIPEMPEVEAPTPIIPDSGGGETGAFEDRVSEQIQKHHEDNSKQAEEYHDTVQTDHDKNTVPREFPPPIDSSYLLASNGTDLVGSQSEGWSERTRAIAQFLRATFDTAVKRPVTLNKLLTGKTRKEAARMFFETLVLRTNDYITVEQKSAYEDISIHYRPKLMKAVF
ncbi:sister chromatid cohesion 1 protein 3 [Selaginella moellendorffii]|nr:sister chromatid cohesion 1 protein 3 [Selaginella moellendorffii]|eukprot:XP_002989794.2 sister chromatid cohesion 1 protein 3 [Selaginella moellendorffii]